MKNPWYFTALFITCIPDNLLFSVVIFSSRLVQSIGLICCPKIRLKNRSGGELAFFFFEISSDRCGFRIFFLFDIPWSGVYCGFLLLTGLSERSGVRIFALVYILGTEWNSQPWNSSDERRLRLNRIIGSTDSEFWLIWFDPMI